PEQAIVPEGDEQYVFRVMDGKAVRTKVETGQRRDAKVEIVKGLGIDDIVVDAGQIKLRDGSPVSILRRDSPVQAAKDDPRDGAREADSEPPKPGPDTAPPRS
ncbi:MAG TPA: efflux transporter periplasmic adaptor subunit, partial [Casimicrobiaceae bacterium]